MSLSKLVKSLYTIGTHQYYKKNVPTIFSWRSHKHKTSLQLEDVKRKKMAINEP